MEERPRPRKGSKGREREEEDESHVNKMQTDILSLKRYFVESPGERCRGFPSNACLGVGQHCNGETWNLKNSAVDSSGEFNGADGLVGITTPWYRNHGRLSDGEIGLSI